MVVLSWRLIKHKLCRMGSLWNSALNLENFGQIASEVKITHIRLVSLTNDSFFCNFYMLLDQVVFNGYLRQCGGEFPIESFFFCCIMLFGLVQCFVSNADLILQYPRHFLCSESYKKACKLVHLETIAVFNFTMSRKLVPN